MKKFFAVLFLFILMAGLTNAQSKMKLGVGGFVGLPMGSFGDVVSLGFGGAVQGEYDFGDKLVGTLTTGYIMFPGKETTVGTVKVTYGDWSIIPILVGAKYYFADNIYGAAQVGLNMVSWKVPASTQNIGGFTINTPEQSFSETKFGYGIGAGYDLGNIDLLVKYGSFATDATYIGLQAIYKFDL